MLINATKDAFQFSVDEAKKSLDAAQEIFRLYGKEDHAQRVVVDAGHGYNQEMREAMYGFMTKHLKGEGNGAPIPEPALQTEEPETLRCFPNDSRPDDFVTVPQFAAITGRDILKRKPVPDHAEWWVTNELAMREALPRVLDGFPKPGPLDVKVTQDEMGQQIEFTPEEGVRVFALHREAKADPRKLAVFLNLDLCRRAIRTPQAERLFKAGWDVVTADLRATGVTARPSDTIRRAPDHNTAEWSLWIGRPILGQWVYDVKRLLDALEKQPGGLPEEVAVIGFGPASLIALCATALDDRISSVVSVGGLASYVSDVPYEKQRLGIMAPGMMRDVGDISHLAALASPRRIVIAGGVDGAGKDLSAEDLQANYAWTKAVYQLDESAEKLHIISESNIVDLWYRCLTALSGDTPVRGQGPP